MRFRNTRTGEIALHADSLIPNTITDENEQYEYAIRYIEYLDPADEGTTTVTRTLYEWRLLYAGIPETLRLSESNVLAATIINAYTDQKLFGARGDIYVTIEIPWGDAMHDFSCLQGFADRPSWYVDGS
jgi:hypothetical protein